MISSHGDTNSRSTCWLPFPPSMELAWVTTGPQASRILTLKRPLRMGILCSALLMSPYVFFFLFFIILWNHWQPCSGALEHPAIVAMINYTFGLKELCPALGMPCEDWRSKLESLSVQMFVYTVSGITGVEQHQNPSYKCIKWGLAKWALATLELICAMRVVIVEDELR